MAAIRFALTRSKSIAAQTTSDAILSAHKPKNIQNNNTIISLFPQLP